MLPVPSRDRNRCQPRAAPASEVGRSASLPRIRHLTRRDTPAWHRTQDQRLVVDVAYPAVIESKVYARSAAALRKAPTSSELCAARTGDLRGLAVSVGDGRKCEVVAAFARPVRLSPASSGGTDPRRYHPKVTAIHVVPPSRVVQIVWPLLATARPTAGDSNPR